MEENLWGMLPTHKNIKTGKLYLLWKAKPALFTQTMVSTTSLWWYMNNHVITITPLPFQWAHCLCFRLLWCHCDVGCCHLLSLEWVDSSRYCYCSSWGCAAAGPAAGEPVSVGHLSSGSHPERGYQSAQEFHWSHTCLLLQDAGSRTMQMNSMPSNYCNLEALHQNTSVLHANRKYAWI